MRHVFLLIALAYSNLSLAAESISAAAAAKAIQAGQAVLVDVREEDEIKAEGMAAPATWLATSEIKSHSSKYQKFLATLDKAKTVVVYCKSGGRASALVDELAKLGYKAANMGGYKNWTLAGQLTKTSP